ncbi:putative RNA-binding Zn ribbon-like protein [Prauserella shujinwangii]|uniref:Putative RNA-binding Zn ribbon-like protein n=1 Tax=Prauserella shujinwangii TaxID=1453103 RepID=A0A2T0LP18_9PSEU|nr:CGNR zinc finger domain-containing protein [Prauserella shujinwangii]PRX44989.1 putative RNA-binding Zn ribbon-like protein [Prauserella shujinwangii]
MHFNPYGGLAAQVAAAVVNAGGTGPEDLVTAMRNAGMASVPRLSVAQAQEIAEWARRLRPVFTETALGTRIALVNDLLADSACRPFVSRHDGLPAHLHYSGEDDGPVRRVQAYTAGGLAHLLCDDPSRCGTCARDGCAVVFVDTSRNGRRRFCSTRCATRVHVARHRDQHRV